VYAVALSEQDPRAAISVFESVYLKHTGSMELVSALAYYSKAAGEAEKAKKYEAKLKALQNFPLQ